MATLDDGNKNGQNEKSPIALLREGDVFKELLFIFYFHSASLSFPWVTVISLTFFFINKTSQKNSPLY